MINILAFLVFVCVQWFWAATYFSLVQKPVFALVNRKSSPRGITFRDTVQVYSHGFVSDAIVASYLTAVPMLLGVTAAIWPGFPLKEVMTVYNIIISLAMGLLTCADTVLYTFWKSKIDASVFAYLRTPKDAFASVSGGYIFLAFLAWMALSAVYFAGAQALTMLSVTIFLHAFMPWWGYPLAVLALCIVAGVLFVIIRGLKIRPNNPSVVYYSNVTFFNHWALNPGYNLIYSLSTRDDFGKQFHEFSPEECREITDPLFPVGGTSRKVLKTDRPNILLIAWESFGREFCGAIGGKPEVTPRFNSLTREGIFFSSCAAGSFRTDRALVCLLGGLPGQPTTSLIRYNRKIAALPGLAGSLRDAGYETASVYGGELNFMHFADYFLASGHDRLVCDKDFPKDAPRCKWGVHDGYIFDWLYDDIMEKTGRNARWFTTFMTLSSHEPFKVPYRRLDDPTDNAYAYVDDALGRFIDRLKQTPAWDNLLVVIVADHGLNRSDKHDDRVEYSHIPLLMIGGAVKEPETIDALMSQTDIAATVLGQLGLDHSEFRFSRDVLADTYVNPFGFHTWVNGFMFRDKTGAVTFDNVSGRPVDGADPARERKGKAILQKLYDYIDKL